MKQLIIILLASALTSFLLSFIFSLIGDCSISVLYASPFPYFVFMMGMLVGGMGMANDETSTN